MEKCPLLRTLLRTLPQNPFQNLLRTLILEHSVAVRPLRRAPYESNQEWLRQTKPKKVRFANFRGTGSGTPFCL